MLLVDRVHEPEVDIFEEGRSLAVLVELPGVREEDVDVHVNGDVLILSTKPGRDDQSRHYYRELLLPFAVEAGSIQRAFRNGVLELELERASLPSEARRKEP
jgi:HSP20 family protein